MAFVRHMANLTKNNRRLARFYRLIFGMDELWNEWQNSSAAFYTTDGNAVKFAHESGRAERRFQSARRCRGNAVSRQWPRDYGKFIRGHPEIVLSLMQSEEKDVLGRTEDFFRSSVTGQV